MKWRGLLLAAVVTIFARCDWVPAGEKVLYEKASPFNTIVVTEDDRGLRTLYFELGGVRQSVVKVGDPDHIELAYARVMPVGLAFVTDPKRILIIGLGGGTIPGLLHKHLPAATIDVVDIDPDVVLVAKRYFGFTEDATLHAYVDDGRRFIEECEEPYDIIFLDAFGSENIPYHLATQEFLYSVRQALTPNGIVVGNIWSRSSNDLYDSMVRTYQQVFHDLYIFDVRGAGNEILVALQRDRNIKEADLARRARGVSKKLDFSFDMGEAVTYGFYHAEEVNSLGQILKDRKRRAKAG
jgi:spermidine synthase